MDAREKEPSAFRRSEEEARSALVEFDGRCGDYVAAGVIHQKSGASAMLLSDPTRGGWRSRRNMAIDDLVSCFMSEMFDTLAQANSATSCVFTWVSQLTKCVSGKRLKEA